jgi:hypothetical protein
MPVSGDLGEVCRSERGGAAVRDLSGGSFGHHVGKSAVDLACLRHDPLYLVGELDPDVGAVLLDVRHSSASNRDCGGDMGGASSRIAPSEVMVYWLAAAFASASFTACCRSRTPSEAS